MSRTELVMELAGVSKSVAVSILKEGDVPTDLQPKTLLAQLDALDAAAAPKVATTVEAVWPDNARKFSKSPKRIELPYARYLRRRGFDDPDGVARAYGLRWMNKGPWSHRILFPLRDAEGTLAGWTGRDITGTSRAKYKSYPTGDAMSGLAFMPSFLPPEDDLLVLVEGPLDALKVDWFAGDLPVQAVALLGLSAAQGPAKQGLVTKLARTVKRVVVAMDAGAEAQAQDIAAALAVLDARVVLLPEGVKDPGELAPEAVKKWLKEILDS
jgi:hypothetical protein